MFAHSDSMVRGGESQLGIRVVSKGQDKSDTTTVRPVDLDLDLDLDLESSSRVVPSTASSTG